MATALETTPLNGGPADETAALKSVEINKYDFRTDAPAVFKARKGIDAEIVAQISEMKGEPAWMREFLKLLDAVTK